LNAPTALTFEQRARITAAMLRASGALHALIRELHEAGRPAIAGHVMLILERLNAVLRTGGVL
jgi:hypothetical protein